MENERLSHRILHFPIRNTHHLRNVFEAADRIMKQTDGIVSNMLDEDGADQFDVAMGQVNRQDSSKIAMALLQKFSAAKVKDRTAVTAKDLSTAAHTETPEQADFDMIQRGIEKFQKFIADAIAQAFLEENPDVATIDRSKLIEELRGTREAIAHFLMDAVIEEETGIEDSYEGLDSQSFAETRITWFLRRYFDAPEPPQEETKPFTPENRFS